MAHLQASRSTNVLAVAISTDMAGAGLPAVTLTVCVPKVEGVGGHEHIVVELTATILDLIEKARSDLADVAIDGR